MDTGLSQRGHLKEFQKLRKYLGQILVWFFFPLAYFVKGTLVFYDIIFKNQKNPTLEVL